MLLQWTEPFDEWTLRKYLIPEFTGNFPTLEYVHLCHDNLTHYNQVGATHELLRMLLLPRRTATILFQQNDVKLCSFGSYAVK